ncbi:hypothetical protein GGI02_005174, partial [Coemansia sp. RSA 2322]
WRVRGYRRFRRSLGRTTSWCCLPAPAHTPIWIRTPQLACQTAIPCLLRSTRTRSATRCQRCWHTRACT